VASTERLLPAGQNLRSKPPSNPAWLKTTFSSPDNGSPYISFAHAAACRLLGIRHLRTRPYRPQTNGKAERFIRTLLSGWAYGAIYRTSTDRTAALDGWLWHHNHRQQHSALGHQPPVSRTNPFGPTASLRRTGPRARSCSSLALASGSFRAGRP
jgi:hypothetical protein